MPTPVPAHKFLIIDADKKQAKSLAEKIAQYFIDEPVVAHTADQALQALIDYNSEVMVIIINATKSQRFLELLKPFSITGDNMRTLVIHANDDEKTRYRALLLGAGMCMEASLEEWEWGANMMWMLWPHAPELTIRYTWHTAYSPRRRLAYAGRSVRQLDRESANTLLASAVFKQKLPWQILYEIFGQDYMWSGRLLSRVQRRAKTRQQREESLQARREYREREGDE